MTITAPAPPTSTPEPTTLTALDLFAGVGWAVACQRLGIHERGVEISDVVVRTRDAAGLETIYGDVWDGLLGVHGVGRYDLLIGSPPCQTFSAAGSRSGSKALAEVLSAIVDGLYRDPVALHALTETLDPRTALVLTPLAHVYRDRPMFVVLEQVPPVLPVWEACATVMRDLGYSVVTELLNAEQYGVPQTRKRAILVGRRDGVEARMPTPTHSRYYPRDPQRLDDGVLPWVSMASALGWSEGIVRSAQSIAGAGRAERATEEPAFTVTQTSSRVLRSNYGTGGDPGARGERPDVSPAPTITSKAGRNQWVRPEVEPWPQSDRPATVIQGDPRVPLRKHHSRESPQMDGALRLTQAEAAALQSFPDGFPFQGGLGERFLTIGNAVPPLLGQAVLAVAVAT